MKVISTILPFIFINTCVYNWGAKALITYDELRGTLQSLIYSYNQLDNKLERHEHRERALGELIKKGLIALQRGQKNLEPIHGIFIRLDERVSQIETMLIAQEEKYNIQTEKLGETLEHIFKWMRDNDECMKRPPIYLPTTTPKPKPQPKDMILINNLNNDMNYLKNAIKDLSFTVNKLLNTSLDTNQQTGIALQSIPHTEQVLTGMTDHLVNLSAMLQAPPSVIIEPANDSIFQDKVLDTLENFHTDLSLLKTESKADKNLSMENRIFLENLNDKVLNELENLKDYTLNISNDALNKTAASINMTEENLYHNIGAILEAVGSSSDILKNFYSQMNNSYSKFNSGLEVFDKFNNILMTNSEYVLDTQRKVEFGTVQIVQKLTEFINQHQKEMINKLNKRFDEINEAFFTNQYDVMQNLSSIIESEVTQVWHQISIMHEDIITAKDLLQKIDQRHDIATNNTHDKITSMGAKVEDIKEHMHDMESNLNYLLGKLSLISQEFNTIKVGLSESLNELRNIFSSIKHKIPQKNSQ